MSVVSIRGIQTVVKYLSTTRHAKAFALQKGVSIQIRYKKHLGQANSHNSLQHATVARSTAHEFYSG